MNALAMPHWNVDPLARPMQPHLKEALQSPQYNIVLQVCVALCAHAIVLNLLLNRFVLCEQNHMYGLPADTYTKFPALEQVRHEVHVILASPDFILAWHAVVQPHLYLD